MKTHGTKMPILQIQIVNAIIGMHCINLDLIPKFVHVLSLRLKTHHFQQSKWNDYATFSWAVAEAATNVFHLDPIIDAVTLADIQVDLYYACTGRVYLDDTHLNTVYKESIST